MSFAERAGRRKRGRRPATQPDASLVGWAAQCLRRDHRGCIGARATYQSYCRWAERCGRQRRDRDQVRPLLDRQHRSHGRQEGRAPAGSVLCRRRTDLGAGSAGRQDGGMSKRTGRIVMGCQIRAARACSTGRGPSLLVLPVCTSMPSPIGSGRPPFPTGRHEPHACRRSERHCAMPVSSSLVTPSRASGLCKNANYVSRPPSRARPRHGVIRVSAHLAVAARNKTRSAVVARRKPSGPCGAKTRTGAPCRRTG